MRKIIYHIASSIDGFIAHENGSVSGFLMEGPHADEFVQSFSNYDTVLMGRGTYEFGFQYGLKAGEPAYQGMKNVIFSSSLQFESNNEVALVAANEADYIQNLKQQQGKDIWLCGGGQLAGFLMQNRLIDEIKLKVNPILLGAGIKLFGTKIDHYDLAPYDFKRYANGVSLQSYTVL